MSSIQQGSLRIVFGALADPIQKQVHQCGLWIDPVRCAVLQSCADSIVRLRIHGVITDGESHKAYQRLMKSIISNVRDRAPNEATGEQSK